MAEYIERDALIKELEERQGWQDQKAACVFKEGYDCGLEATLEDVKQAITADVAPVVHGEWIKSEEHKPWLTCSVCHDCYVDGEWVDGHKWSYCPNCGARMEGGEEDAAD